MKAAGAELLEDLDEENPTTYLPSHAAPLPLRPPPPLSPLCGAFADQVRYCRKLAHGEIYNLVCRLSPG